MAKKKKAPGAARAGRFRNPQRLADMGRRLSGADQRSETDKARASARAKTQAARDAAARK